MAEDKIASALPVTLKDLRKHTLASMLFLCLIAVSVLYGRSEKKSTVQTQRDASEIQELKKEVKQLRTEVSFMQEQARRSDSALASVTAILKTLEKYNRIIQ